VSCMVCGKKLSDPSPNGDKGGENRMDYYPKQKKVVGMHYYCSWMNLMGKILELGRAVSV